MYRWIVDRSLIGTTGTLKLAAHRVPRATVHVACVVVQTVLGATEPPPHVRSDVMCPGLDGVGLLDFRSRPYRRSRVRAEALSRRIPS